MLGESASFRELCGQAIPAVYSYVLPRVGGDVAVAQDVTSEAMLAGVAAFRRGEGDRLSQAWFITVARRRLVDRWRRGERESRRLRLVWAAGRGDNKRLDVEEPVSRTRTVSVMASLHATVALLTVTLELVVRLPWMCSVPPVTVVVPV